MIKLNVVKLTQKVKTPQFIQQQTYNFQWVILNMDNQRINNKSTSLIISSNLMLIKVKSKNFKTMSEILFEF